MVISSHLFIKISKNKFNKCKSKPKKEYSLQKIHEWTEYAMQEEFLLYKNDSDLNFAEVCVNYHGGPLDYPKSVNKSIMIGLGRWDYCFDALKQKLKHHDGTSHLETKEYKEFCKVINDSAKKCYRHNEGMIKVFLTVNDTRNILYIIGGVSLIRNKLWEYNANFQTCDFEPEYKSCVLLIEAAGCHVVEYYVEQIKARVSHFSQDPKEWEKEKVKGKEKVSHCIIMSWYYIQQFRQDLWTSIPPRTARNIFADFINKIYQIFVLHYSNICPSPTRVQVFRADLNALILIASEVLYSIVYSVNSIYFEELCRRDNLPALNFINKVWLLMQILTSISSPLPVLVPRLMTKQHIENPETKMKEAKLSGFHFIIPKFFPVNANAMTLRNYLGLLINIITRSPEIIWSNVILFITYSNNHMGKLILRKIGLFIPEMMDSQESSIITEIEMEGCGKLYCKKECIESQKLNWLTLICTGLIKIVTTSSKDPNSLIKLFKPIILIIEEEKWIKFQNKYLWEGKKSVWFQSIIHFIEPYVIQIVNKILEGIFIKHREVTVEDIFNISEKALPDLPVCFIKLTLYLDKELKKYNTKSASMLNQFMIWTIYDLIAHYMHNNIDYLDPKEVEHLKAVNELYKNNLSSPEMNPHLIEMDKLAKDFVLELQKINKSAELKESCFYESNSEAEGILIGNKIGLLALRAVHRFICFNKYCLQSCIVDLKSTSTISILTPWSKNLFQEVNPKDMINKVGGFTDAIDHYCAINPGKYKQIYYRIL